MLRPLEGFEAMLEPSFVSNLLVAVAITFMLVLAFMGKWAKKCGMAWTSLYGQFIAALLFMALATVGRTSVEVYVQLMIVLFYFSGLAGLFANPMAMGIVPPDQRDKWISRQSLFQNFSSAVGPFPRSPPARSSRAATWWPTASRAPSRHSRTWRSRRSSRSRDRRRRSSRPRRRRPRRSTRRRATPHGRASRSTG